MESINWKKDINIDDAYEKIDFHEYSSQTGVNLNTDHGDIRIVIQNQDQFLLPSKSYIYIEAQLLQEDGTEYAEADEITLTNNGLMYLFERVSYKISQQELESYSNPGIATTVKGMLTYPDDFSEGMQFMWKRDGGIRVNNNPGFTIRRHYTKKSNGKFSAAIPLTHIFGFCENYNKIMYGVEHTLVLRRNHDDNAIFRAVKNAQKVDMADGQIVISKLSWNMPHVKLGEEHQIRLYNDIRNEVQIPIRFLSRQCERYTIPKNQSNLDWRLNITTGSEKPRYIFLVFQKGKLDDQTENAAIFDHIHFRNAYIQINNERYPDQNLDVDFKENRYAKAYRMLYEYYHDTLGKDSVSFGIVDFKDLYPILVFDVSRQSERLKNTPVDIRIKVEFSEPVSSANVEAYAIILSDRYMKLESDGSKMNMVY